MDGIGNKLVPLGGYPKELHEKAIEMYKQGYKKAKIAEILGVGRTTVRRWTKTGSHTYLKPHSSEEKQKAIDLVSSGISRKEVSDRLGISYFTIVYWCRGINTWCKHPSYPTILKRKARKMVRSGITKREVAGMLGISYNTLCSWTADIHNSNSRLSGAAEKILAEVVEKGYFFPKPKQLNICRVLKQDVGLRLVRLNGKWILYTNNGKELAMKSMLEKEKLNYLSAKKIENVKRLFKFDKVRQI